ncbi:MAG: NAD-dependent epimerase/dehydratase family protein [Lentisphaeria bacterium]|nr:NAD-dependent epimerase/dehydratase family protein [Lentisphaeria bacterium]MBO5803307.1 NAD-dependent epimerase/dehydratase family protein [Lentisphaeria bacterium]
MKVLITGGAGFIGSHLTRALLSAGHTVAVIDDLSTGSLDNITEFQKDSRYRFIKGDILVSGELEELIADCDTVFHLAAAVGVELVVHDPVRTILTNVQGTERVLTAATKYDKRIILASTSEVYGKSAKPLFAETDDLLIGPSTHSRWSYACSKLMDEFLLMAYFRDRGLRGTVVRFFNTVGPGQTGRYGMVIPRFVAAALSGDPLKVFGTGEQTRCFCHVSDVVRALLLLMETPDSYGGIYNIGSTEKVTIRQLAEFVIHELNSSSKIDMIPYDQAYANGFEDMLHRAPDCSKLYALTNWQAEIPLKQIIADVAESLRKNA